MNKLFENTVVNELVLDYIQSGQLEEYGPSDPTMKENWQAYKQEFKLMEATLLRKKTKL